MVSEKKTIGFFDILWQFIFVFIGMLGVRLDRGKTLFVWIPLAILSYLLSLFIYTKGWWISYVIFFWVFYYVGNALILGTPISSWMIKKFGEKMAFSIYEVILGLMFMNSAFAITQFIAFHSNTVFISPIILWVISVPIFIISFGSKFWAAWLTGLDIYYYKDLFLNKRVGKFIKAGPYKIFKNPMYGVGYLYGYLGALIFQSKEGLIFVAICHAGIYTFNYLVEQPFVKRTYLS
ncbi:MAG: phosphatidylethanolamine N-methyltransferase family protein [archaeon]|nr:phosphatidylethanolamine N-methyltransferase family protein [archaeon]MCR4323897.1 phosphatidylethanolamine N-methyltransferase family protein [Nanoarchaeota archaeon]